MCILVNHNEIQVRPFFEITNRTPYSSGDHFISVKTRSCKHKQTAFKSRSPYSSSEDQFKQVRTSAFLQVKNKSCKQRPLYSSKHNVVQVSKTTFLRERPLYSRGDHYNCSSQNQIMQGKTHCVQIKITSFK